MGHGLDYNSTKYLCKIKQVCEFNVGHFIIGEAIIFGIKHVIKNLEKLLQIRAQMFHYKKIFNNKKTLIIILSFLFALSVQKTFLFQGSDVLLINSIKSLNFEKLSSDLGLHVYRSYTSLYLF